MISKTSGQIEKPPQSHELPSLYSKYLKIDELKKLQVCASEPPHHDEHFFIIIHQAYELWFKVILHEIDAVLDLMAQDKVLRATFYMRRVIAVLKLLVQQVHLLETMSPKDYLAFRYSLGGASGLQSSQFREIEFSGGLKSLEVLEHFKADPDIYERLSKRYHDPSLPEAFYKMLTRRGFSLPKEEASKSAEENEALKQKRILELAKIYNDQDTYHDLLELAETFVDFDEQLFFWRIHHVTVVERIIGFKRGTGGTKEGVSYLRSTLDKRCFSELWQLRTCLT